MAASLRDELRRLAKKAHTARGIPYQSVYHRGVMMLQGERTDLLERHALIRPEDLTGRAVLDMGCNIGAASFLACESGAHVEGWDRDPACVWVASALAVTLGLTGTFRMVDLAAPPVGRWDTGFAFSVARHVHGAIQPALRQCAVVYVETNVRDGRVLRPEVSDGWAVELVGATHGGSRDLYRMER